MDLIPISQKKELEILSILKKIGFFGKDIYEFITLFNTGVLSKEQPKVVDILKKIEDNYVNVQVVKDKILIKSQEEVAAENSVNILKEWVVISALKRVSRELFEAGYLPDTKIGFKKENVGFPYVEQINEKGEKEFVEYPSSKLFLVHDDIWKFILTRSIVKHSKEYDFFYLYDLVDIENYFLVDIEKRVLKNTFVMK